MKPIIEVKNVNKSFVFRNDRSLFAFLRNLIFKKKYSRINSLKDISFTVNKGEFIGVIGPNGSGKSTLMKIILGLYSPTSGTVIVRGKHVGIIELNIGFEYELTARENIFLSSILLGSPRHVVKKNYEKILQFAGLKKFENIAIKRFSLGMVSRLSFSVAAHTNPDIFVLDEAFAVGDGAFEKKSYEKLVEFKKKGKTIFFAGHNLALIEKLCDKVILLEKGKMTLFEDVGAGVMTYLHSVK